MYLYEDRLRAVRLYIELGKRIGLTIWQLGYPTKNALKTWPSGSTSSTTAALRRWSRRWVIPRDHCCPRGFKNWIRRSACVSLGDPRNWRLQPSSLPSSPYLTSNQPQQLEFAVDIAVRRYPQREPSEKRWFACRSGDETGTRPPRGSDGCTWRT